MRKPKWFKEAVDSVECSCIANNFGNHTVLSYEATAKIAAVDWLNDHKLGVRNGNPDRSAEIVAAVLKRAGFS